MIKVKSIHWLDEDAREADIILTDGEYNVVCFSHSCEFALNGVYNELIYCFDPINIFKLNQKEYSMEVPDDNSDFYILKGKLIDATDSIIQIGEFRIDISESDIAQDIHEGDFVELKVHRIDTE
ncbi:hypothetical protein CSI37_08260 [Listeria monocytogenes]|uniref:Uncharacterized protein n=1 Tax=Listeria monocytogenes serotype 1/2a TaxID=1906951 RepID=A0A9P1YKA8_LISMN|nr:hypothetical protein [Listeria monocytogenes]EAF3073134.1 hypothetical protein [Listeria monocytogenes serotype 1/2a]EAC5232747.1 hypothetical protein [Listeria monocytogenes]EAC8512678.1 hypothetical protein [Listeria monocytogenes]EAE9671177.1 hypothetical protein [Listeria monocytogenes]EAF3114697.1 hypothetical protein [Listeria monocytogenes]